MEIIKTRAGLIEENYKRNGIIPSNSPEFYVYALLNPTKPGSYKYDFCGQALEFDHEPFYIGKGNKDRISDHEREAKKNPKPNSGEYKLNVIRKLHRQGLS